MSRLRATDHCCGGACVCVCVWRWLNGWKETVHQCEIWKQFDCIKAFKASPLISLLASRQYHTHPLLCAAGEERTEGLSQLCIHLSVCFFIYTFVYSFIHLLLTSFWSSCHLLYNRWTVTFVCICNYLCTRVHMPCACYVFKLPECNKDVWVLTGLLIPITCFHFLIYSAIGCPITHNNMIDNQLMSNAKAAANMQRTCKTSTFLWDYKIHKRLDKSELAYFWYESVHCHFL